MGGRRRPLPVPVTKGLVAHRTDRALELDLPYGPADGDPVGIPRPCARLVAGYWCSCGSGFAADSMGEPVTQARVVGVPAGAWCGFVDEPWVGGGWSDPGHGRGVADRDALQRAIEDLPVGTVVERFGVGLAPAFLVQTATPFDRWGEPGATLEGYPF